MTQTCLSAVTPQERTKSPPSLLTVTVPGFLGPNCTRETERCEQQAPGGLPHGQRRPCPGQAAGDTRAMAAPSSGVTEASTPEQRDAGRAWPVTCDSRHTTLLSDTADGTDP